MKKLIACLLVLCLLVPVSALSFTDAAAIRHDDEVAIFTDLGLIGGYTDGTFRPNDNIRRSEAAKLIALISEANPKTNAAVRFSDVPSSHWAANYIAYCSEKQIIAGANGVFRPNDFVTGREFAKMLLVCVGNDGSKYVGANWAQAVDQDAQANGVYDGFTADPGRVLSRDDACLLMYNAMQCSAVSGKDANGKPVFVLDELMNPVTYMEYRFGVVKFKGVLVANEYADLTKAGGALNAGMSKLAGHTAAAFATDYMLLGRTLELTTIRSGEEGETHYTVIGNPSLPGGEETCVATSASDYVIVLRYFGYTTNAATQYYLNGDATNETFLTRLGDDCVITGIDRNGDRVLDAVVTWNYTQGTVRSTEPLQILADGSVTDVIALTDEAIAAGDQVRCLKMGGRYYLVKGLSE